MPGGRFVMDIRTFFNTSQLSLIGVAYFCYSISAALLFQYVVLPSIPSMHAGIGLLAGDSLYFHTQAAELARAIAIDGWSVWRPWPPHCSGCYGNVAVLAALYAVFGPDPVSVIPVNAALHAASGVLLILIGQKLYAGPGGRWAGFVAGTIFVVMPSSLNWYAQVHRDAYSIFGFLLVVYAGLRSIEAREGVRRYAGLCLALAFSGLAITAFVRPHNLQLYMGMAVLLAVAAVVRLRQSFGGAAPMGVIALIVLAAVWVKPEVAHQMMSSPDVFVSVEEAEENPSLARLRKWKWSPTEGVPEFVESIPKRLSNFRVFMAAYGVRESAQSMNDLDSMPSSLGEFLTYIPRATQIGTLAPFPLMWGDKLSLARLVGIAEISLMYLALPGVFAILWMYRRSLVVWWVASCAVLMLTAEGYLITNLGTLHRLRYPYLLLLILLGLMGWSILLQKWRTRQYPGVAIGDGCAQAGVDVVGSKHVQGAGNAVRRGMVFVALSACLFGGYFIRDILLVRKLGLGAELDSYQLASFFPLFLTVLLAVPLGPVVINQFISIRENKGVPAAAAWVQALSMGAVTIFSILSLAAFLVGFGGVYGATSEVDLGRTRELAFLMIPVVAFSATVVIGNSVLTSSGKAEFVAGAQLVVPALCLAMIVLFSDQLGALAAMLGLAVGQIANMYLVATAASAAGYSMSPKRGDIRWREWIGQYVPLVGAAALTGASIPVGVFLASGLPLGGVSAFSLGAKVLMAITSLVSALLVAMVLPHFSRLLAENRAVQAKNSLSLVVSLGVIFAVPFAVGLYICAEFFAAMLFEGGKVGKADVSQLAAVIRFGALQLPFFIVLAILVKYMVANKTALAVLVSAVIGQTANVAVAPMLVSRFSTSGVAMAMSLGVAVSALCLICWATVRHHVELTTLVLIAISWMLFCALCVCLAFSAYLGTAICVAAFFAVSISTIAALSKRFVTSANCCG